MKRSIYWDVARGMAMMVVVFAHAIGYLDGQAFAHPMHWIISTFQMVVFFVISGAVLALHARTETFRGFVLHKAKALLVPYFVWLVISCICLHGFSDIVTLSYNGGLWFLRVLFFVFVLHACGRYGTSVVQKLNWPRGCSFVLYAILIAVAWVLAKIPNLTTFRQLGYFFIWFELGYWLTPILSTHTNADRFTAPKTAMLLFVGSLLLFACCIPVLLRLSPGQLFADQPIPPMFRPVIVPMALLGSLALLSAACLFATASKPGCLSKILVFTGRHSLAFYAVHCFLFDVLTKARPVSSDSSYCLTPTLGAFVDLRTGDFFHTLILFVIVYLASAGLVLTYQRTVSGVQGLHPHSRRAQARSGGSEKCLNGRMGRCLNGRMFEWEDV